MKPLRTFAAYIGDESQQPLALNSLPDLDYLRLLFQAVFREIRITTENIGQIVARLHLRPAWVVFGWSCVVLSSVWRAVWRHSRCW